MRTTFGAIWRDGNDMGGYVAAVEVPDGVDPLHHVLDVARQFYTLDFTNHPEHYDRDEPKNWGDLINDIDDEEAFFAEHGVRVLDVLSFGSYAVDHDETLWRVDE